MDVITYPCWSKRAIGLQGLEWLLDVFGRFSISNLKLFGSKKGHWKSVVVINSLIMMTSSNETIFRVTGPLCLRSPVNSPHKGQWRGALMFSLICARINGWVNNGEAGDLRRHRAHYDVIVMDAWKMPGIRLQQNTRIRMHFLCNVWICNVIPHFIMDVITYPCWD